LISRIKKRLLREDAAGVLYWFNSWEEGVEPVSCFWEEDKAAEMSIAD